MEKTFTVRLNQTVFNIDENAYQNLSKYLESIRKHFQKTDDADEIIADIEASAASHFTDLLGKNKSVITEADVDSLIESMGTINDITGDNEISPPTSGPSGKKMFRNSDDKVIGGVASGLAAYFGIETVIIRVLLAVCFLLIHPISGTVFILYLILWFAIPEAKTSADKIQMKGEPVNLASLENAVEEKAHSLTQNQKLIRLIKLPFEVLIKVVAKVAPALALIIGICLTVFVALGMAALTSAFVNFLPNLPALALASVYLSAFVPLLFILLIGVSLIRGRSVFNLIGSLLMIFVWVFALSSLAFSAVVILPRYQTEIGQFLDQHVEQLNLTPQDRADFDQFRQFLSPPTPTSVPSPTPTPTIIIKKAIVPVKNQ